MDAIKLSDGEWKLVKAEAAADAGGIGRRPAR